MFDKIKAYVRNTMEGYTDSRQPTTEQVYLAWCISEIEDLRSKLNDNIHTME